MKNQYYDIPFNPKLIGNKDHPEHYCHKCNGRNIIWNVDNKLWNAVMGNHSDILCPICFIELAEAKGIKPAAWRLSCEGNWPEKGI